MQEIWIATHDYKMHDYNLCIVQFGRFLIKLAVGAPDRKPVHGDGVEYGQQDRGET